MPTYRIFKETDDQDLAIEGGDIAFLEDQDAVVQQIGTALRNSKNDYFLDLDEGLRWVDNERGILGASDLSPENEAEIIQKTAGVFGVTQLVSFTADFTNPEDFEIKESVLTEFSQTPVEVTL